MRTMNRTALLVPLLLFAAAPAAAQVTSPGPVRYNSPRIPAPQSVVPRNPGQFPGRGRVSPNPPRYDSPRFNGRRNDRWGGNVNGRWHAGWQAPGGWGGYRRPSRGWTLPHYWMGTGFHIPDYRSFGLFAPPVGYFWVRYYDDAVLVDSYGRVRDSVSGIAWAGADAYADVDDGYGYAGAAASASAGAITGVDLDPGYYEPGYYEDDRYGGYESYEDESDEYLEGGYASPVAGGPPAVQHYPSCHQRCPGHGAGYGGGYYYGGPVTTTIVIQSGGAATTTVTEEIIEETTTTTTTSGSRYYAPSKRVIRKGPVRKYRTKLIRR